MSFIDKRVLDDEEKIVSRTKLHPIYILKGLGFLSLMTAIALGLEMLMLRYFGPVHAHGEPIVLLGLRVIPMALLKAALFAGGVWIFLVYLIKFIDSEIVITNERVIYKHGWILVKVEEIDLDEMINEEQVDHGWFGRFLDYGTVYLDCRFVRDIQLPAIRHPHEFVKALHQARRDFVPH